MDDARIQQLITEKGVQSFSTSEEWVNFYHSLRQKVSGASHGDPEDVFDQICEISKQAIQARADQLRSGDSYRHTSVKYAAISAVPLGKATAGRKQTKNFENETLEAFGLGDKEYLGQIRESFHNHFHSKSTLAIGVVGSAAGGALAMAGMTPVGFAVGRSVRALEGAWVIRKTMRRMIELAITLALAIHTEIFIPLVMAELWYVRSQGMSWKIDLAFLYPGPRQLNQATRVVSYSSAAVASVLSRQLAISRGVVDVLAAEPCSAQDAAKQMARPMITHPRVPQKHQAKSKSRGPQ